MQLILKEKSYNIMNCNVNSEVSIKSGNEIKNFNGLVRIPNLDNPQDIDSNINAVIYDENNNMEIVCSIHVNRSTHSDSLPYWEFDISCKEVENYSVKELNINGKTIIPYSYEEEVFGSALIITLKTKVDYELFEAIKNIYFSQKTDEIVQYFNVTRPGLITKRMRLGQPVWSKHDGSYKIQLTIVEKIYDEENNSSLLNEPEMSNMKGMIAQLNLKAGKLIDKLYEKGIITEEEKNELLQKEDKDYESELFKMKKVLDIDSFK